MTQTPEELRALERSQRGRSSHRAGMSWQTTVSNLARLHGWRVQYHRDSRGCPPGWPDLICWRERVAFIECKSGSAKLTSEQAQTIRDLRRAGAEVYVARPADLEALHRILEARIPPSSAEADRRNDVLRGAIGLEAFGRVAVDSGVGSAS